MQMIEALRLIPQDAKFVRVDALPGATRVTAGLAEAQMTVSCAANGKAGAYAVEGRIARFARALEGEAQAALHDNRLRITAGAAVYGFHTLEADCVPELAEPESWQRIGVDPRALRGALGYVADAAAKNDIRYYLNGVLIRAAGEAVDVVATDGHVAAFAAEAVAGATDAKVIVPTKCVGEILRLLDEEDGAVVEVGVRGEEATMLRVRAGEVTYIAIGYASEYPAYRTIFERAKPKASAVLDAEAALTALKRLTFAVEARVPTLRLTVKAGSLMLASAGNGQTNAEGSETIALSGAAQAEFECGVNLDFLEAALAAARGVAKDVALGWRSPQEPLTVRPHTEGDAKAEARSWIVMPCNL